VLAKQIAATLRSLTMPACTFGRRFYASMSTGLAIFALATTSACGSSSPSPPASSLPSPPVTVQGTEHFAWNQQADSLDDIRQYAFVAYVDDAPQALPDAACASSGDSTSVQFDCSARLPPMSLGAHRLQIAAAREVNGVSLEGPRSDPLNVLVMPAASGNASASGDSRLAVTAADGTMFTVETLASGLAAPAGLAPAPDG
jgi:hypothetical protein